MKEQDVIQLKIDLPFNQEIWVKREDLIHKEISGNKFRKLKYNMVAAKAQGATTLVTFGGAFSNHIAATAAAGRIYGMKTIGFIRGDELADKPELNPTLQFAKSQDMQLTFVSRERYRELRELHSDLDYNAQFPELYFLPEGGNNDKAILGCEEILTAEDAQFDYICCAVGTGGTISGIMNSVKAEQQVLGFAVLKGVDWKSTIANLTPNTNYRIKENYHFEGYAKFNLELIEFINEFKAQYGIPLDPVYTGKLMYGVVDLLKKGYFRPQSKILIIHTGGLQGIAGFNELLEKKNLPRIL